MSDAMLAECGSHGDAARWGAYVLGDHVARNYSVDWVSVKRNYLPRLYAWRGVVPAFTIAALLEYLGLGGAPTDPVRVVWEGSDFEENRETIEQYNPQIEVIGKWLK